MTYLNILKNKWQTIAVVTLGTVVLSLVLSLIQPLEYRSRVDLLVVQKQSQTLDTYAAARASEKLASNLAVIATTKSFYDKVITGGFGIKTGNFPKQEQALRKTWQDKVKAKVFPETSILSILVYDQDKKEADKIAYGVAQTLITSAQEYYGLGQDTMVKIVNAPLSSLRPVKPNIILNVGLGFLVGLFLSLSYIIYNYQRAWQKELAGYERKLRKANREVDVEEEIFKPQVVTMYDNL